MAESVDCSEFCRLCLVKEQVNTPIFEELGDLQQIYVKITACLPIKVSLEDPLPKRICDDCSYKLDQQYQFWNTSLNSEKQLKQWLGIPDEPPPTKSEGRIKKEKDTSYEPVSKRPRRNARRKAAANVRQAAAAAAASDSGPGEDMDLEPFAKEENDSDNDMHDNTESMGDSSYMNVGLDQDDQGEAGPSGLQKTATNTSGTASGDAAAQGNDRFYLTSPQPTQQQLLSSYNNESSSSRLFNPLLHISSNNHTYTHYNSDIYDATDESYTNDYNSESFQTIDSVSHQSFNDVRSPICNYNTDDASLHSNTSFTESLQCLNNLENTSNTTQHHRSTKLTAKEKKELAEIQKRQSLTADGKYECSECKEQFITNFKLQYHRKSAHEERKFKCEICFKAFLTSHHLKMHSAIHIEIKPFSCDQCSASFRYKKLLERHKTSYHITVKCDELITAPSSNAQQNETPLLTTVTPGGNQPLAHIDKTLPFACSQCELRFATRNAYNHHTKSHKITISNIGNVATAAGAVVQSLEKLKFPCDVCGKELATRESLSCHKQTHCGEKNLHCEICSKAFSHKKYLQVHQRIHSGLKPYVCPTCGKSFTQASTLTVHRRYHSGERPYTCNICNKGFVTRTIMLTHMKKHP